MNFIKTTALSLILALGLLVNQSYPAAQDDSYPEALAAGRRTLSQQQFMELAEKVDKGLNSEKKATVVVRYLKNLGYELPSDTKSMQKDIQTKKDKAGHYPESTTFLETILQKYAQINVATPSIISRSAFSTFAETIADKTTGTKARKLTEFLTQNYESTPLPQNLAVLLKSQSLEQVFTGSLNIQIEEDQHIRLSSNQVAQLKKKIKTKRTLVGKALAITSSLKELFAQIDVEATQAGLEKALETQSLEEALTSLGIHAPQVASPVSSEDDDVEEAVAEEIPASSFLPEESLNESDDDVPSASASTPRGTPESAAEILSFLDNMPNNLWYFEGARTSNLAVNLERRFVIDERLAWEVAHEYLSKSRKPGVDVERAIHLCLERHLPKALQIQRNPDSSSAVASFDASASSSSVTPRRRTTSAAPAYVSAAPATPLREPITPTDIASWRSQLALYTNKGVTLKRFLDSKGYADFDATILDFYLAEGQSIENILRNADITISHAAPAPAGSSTSTAVLSTNAYSSSFPHASAASDTSGGERPMITSSQLHNWTSEIVRCEHKGAALRRFLEASGYGRILEASGYRGDPELLNRRLLRGDTLQDILDGLGILVQPTASSFPTWGGTPAPAAAPSFSTWGGTPAPAPAPAAAPSFPTWGGTPAPAPAAAPSFPTWGGTPAPAAASSFPTWRNPAPTTASSAARRHEEAEATRRRITHTNASGAMEVHDYAGKYTVNGSVAQVKALLAQAKPDVESLDTMSAVERRIRKIWTKMDSPDEKTLWATTKHQQDALAAFKKGFDHATPEDKAALKRIFLVIMEENMDCFDQWLLLVLKDCLGAYGPGGSTSCAAGVVERALISMQTFPTDDPNSILNQIADLFAPRNTAFSARMVFTSSNFGEAAEGVAHNAPFELRFPKAKFVACVLLDRLNYRVDVTEPTQAAAAYRGYLEGLIRQFPADLDNHKFNSQPEGYEVLIIEDLADPEDSTILRAIRLVQAEREFIACADFLERATRTASGQEVRDTDSLDIRYPKVRDVARKLMNLGYRVGKTTPREAAEMYRNHLDGLLRANQDLREGLNRVKYAAQPEKAYQDILNDLSSWHSILLQALRDL